MVSLKFWVIGLYIWIRIKILSYQYDISADKILYAYNNLYRSFKNVKMILERCKYEAERNFCIEVKSAIEAKRQLEEFEKIE